VVAATLGWGAALAAMAEQAAASGTGGVVIEPVVLFQRDDAMRSEESASWPSFADSFFEGRFLLGTRMTRFWLTDDSAPTNQAFLGAINQLDDEQDLAPTKICLDVLLGSYVALELTWDRVEATVRNYNNGFTDGTVEMSGPVLTVMGRYPNRTLFVPYAGLGLALFRSSFDEEPYWHYGYASPASYRAAGSPTTPLGGKERSLTVDDDTGLVFTAGCRAYITEHWAADLLLRHVELDPSARFRSTVYGTPASQDDGHFPLSHNLLGLGMSYRF
jgi:outer membrane protein W